MAEEARIRDWYHGLHLDKPSWDNLSPNERAHFRKIYERVRDPQNQALGEAGLLLHKAIREFKRSGTPHEQWLLFCELMWDGSAECGSAECRADTRFFDVADVLSVTTGRNLSPRGMVGLRDILGFVCGSEEPTDVGCVALKPLATERLLAQHPKLAELPWLDEDTPESFLERARVLLGSTLEISAGKGTPT